MITLYTDGSSLGNPGPGGYGVLLRYKQHEKMISQGYVETTNNRMELMGVIAGLEALKKPKQRVVIYSDSKYVVDAVEKGWLSKWIRNQFKGKKNSDLWVRFWRVYQNHFVTLKWVKGHAGYEENERCDQLAVAAATKGPWIEDEGYVGSHNKIS